MKHLATLLIVLLTLAGCAAAPARSPDTGAGPTGKSSSAAQVISIVPHSSDDEGNEIVRLPDGATRAPADHAANVDQVVKGILAQTNAFRRANGRSEVSPENRLRTAAQTFATYMARKARYGHTADGRRPGSRAAAAGYRFCVVGENIAYQFRSSDFTADELGRRFTQGWINSPSHRQNMLDPDVFDTAVAVARSDDGVYYAVQLFGRPEELRVSFEVDNPSDQTLQYSIGSKSFSLSPHMSRTHGESRPAMLSVANGKPASIPAKRGATYLLTPGEGGSVRVETRSRS